MSQRDQRSDSRRQFRLTRSERAVLARSVMIRLEMGPPWHDDQEQYQLRQLLELLSD